MSRLSNLAYVSSGEDGAPWVTFVPGIGNDAEFWRRQADEIADQFRTLRFELWGCGGSQAPPQDCTIDDVVDGIVELWNRVGIERSSVVGLGFGGSAALYLGIRHRGRVERVVACCCRARQPDDRRQFWRERQAFARERGIPALADVTLERWLRPKFRADHPKVTAALRAAIGRNSVEGYCAYVDAFIDMDFDERLSALDAPTLLIAGEHDHGGGPVEVMRAMCDVLGDARLSVIEDSGHICNHEAPEQVARLLRGHLRPG